MGIDFGELQRQAGITADQEKQRAQDHEAYKISVRRAADTKVDQLRRAARHVGSVLVDDYGLSPNLHLDEQRNDYYPKSGFFTQARSTTTRRRIFDGFAYGVVERKTVDYQSDTVDAKYILGFDETGETTEVSASDALRSDGSRLHDETFYNRVKAGDVECIIGPLPTFEFFRYVNHERTDDTPYELSRAYQSQPQSYKDSLYIDRYERIIETTDSRALLLAAFANRFAIDLSGIR